MTAVHGGDLVAIGEAFGCEPASLIDFSANVNPWGPPAAVAAVLRAVAARPSLLARYPDPAASELRAALAARARRPPEEIVVANGSAALLDVAVRALAPARCVLPVPTFSEYERALRAAGVEVVPFALRPDEGFRIDRERLVALARRVGAAACILANPHNPSGRGEPAGTIAALIGRLAGFGCATILDQAFVDYAPELGVEPFLPLGERTIVLRSLTKFFAIPGVRVGYGLAAPPLAARIRTLLPSWPVGAIEQQLALAVLDDALYLRMTIEQNARACATFVRDLEAIGCAVFPPAANFVLCDVRALCRDPRRLRDVLIRERRLVVRTFADDALLAEAYVRLAVRRPAENAKLVAAFAAFAEREEGPTQMSEVER